MTKRQKREKRQDERQIRQVERVRNVTRVVQNTLSYWFTPHSSSLRNSGTRGRQSNLLNTKTENTNVTNNLNIDTGSTRVARAKNGSRQHQIILPPNQPWS